MTSTLPPACTPRLTVRIFCLLALLTALVPGVAPAQPAVVPTAEGQMGETPGLLDQVIGTRFESIRGQPGDVLLGGIFVFGGIMPVLPPEMSFATDTIHGTPNPQPVTATQATFDDVFKVPPASARARNAADDGDFVAFSFAVDGALPQTMQVRVATFDETGSSVIEVPVATVGTFPDPAFSGTGVAVDDQGRVTVVYTDLPAVGTPNVRARRLDAMGNPIGSEIPINPAAFNLSSVALLDPAGDRLIIPSSDFSTIKGNIVDVSGGVPQVLPEFPVNSTPATFSVINPAVAADPATGAFTVAWEDVTAVQGDPINVRARRFDAMGNPIGGDFLVNTTTANAQAQPAVAYGPQGLSAIVWAGDSGVLGNELDVFAQFYDALGNPIGGEIRANTATADVQDRPTVRFLPEPDGQGRPQAVVAWRDVGNADGSLPEGTGTSYKCFSIDGLGDPSAIFADGFESGDTSSWSVVVP